MKGIIAAGLLVALSACNATGGLALDATQQRILCGERLNVIQIGEEEYNVRDCLVTGRRLYLDHEWQDGAGNHRAYIGSGTIKRVYVLNGKVTGWDK